MSGVGHRSSEGRWAEPRFTTDQFVVVARAGLRAEFDAQVGLVGPAPYFLPASIAYAWLLLRGGSPAEQPAAEAALRLVLAAQEQRRDHPDYGHFPLCWRDEVRDDLNAVQLALIELIPLTLTFGERLAADLREQLRSAVAAGLAALERVAVEQSYTNVAVLDIANRVLGGQLVGDLGTVHTGRTKLADFLERLVRDGGPRDYGSPTYLGQMLTTLATLADHAVQPEVVALAEICAERIWLQVHSRYHPELTQIAGPYCRGYLPEVGGGPSHLKSLLYGYLADDGLLGPGRGLGRMSPLHAFALATRSHRLPAHLLSARGNPASTPLPIGVVREGADRTSHLYSTSYLGAAHAFGTSSKGFGSQARNLLIQARPRGGTGAKVLFSRYLIDGDPLDLNAPEALAEYGRFVSLQSTTRAIVLYGARTDYRAVRWMGTEISLLGVEERDAVWSHDRPVEHDRPMASQQWIFFDLGPTYVAVYPLAPTPLGDGGACPVRILRDAGRLRMTIANYAGPPRHFWKYTEIPWEYRDSEVSPFFNGHLHAGLAIQTADASHWADFGAFRRTVASATLTDSTEARLRRVTLHDRDETLTLGVDLMSFEPVERLVNGRGLRYDLLTGPTAIQLADGPATLAGHTVSSDRPGPWIVARGGALYVTNPTAQTVRVTVDAAVHSLAPRNRLRVVPP